MPTPKYDFTANNGQLLIELDNSLNEWESEESNEYRESSANLYNNKIQIYNHGDFKKDFLFENIKTVGGVSPTDINNAYVLLLALIPA